jgi:Tol biopolymer transport system component/DNA-binding winged helix-turn-helix (wHTH) protein
LIRNSLKGSGLAGFLARQKTGPSGSHGDTLCATKAGTMATESSERPRILRFGTFEADLAARELRKGGIRIKLQGQPFELLAMLLERPGEVLPREELRQRLWSTDTFVDFDAGLNTAINRLREALGDSAENPRFIETVPRRGYRFVASVRSDDPPIPSQEVSQNGSKSQIKEIVQNRWLPLWLCLVVLILGIGGWWFHQRRTESSLPPVLVVPLAGLRGAELNPAFSPDGNQVAFRLDDGQQNSGIFTALVGGEKPLQLTKDQNDTHPAWSPDGSQVAFLRISDQLADVYVVPALGGTEHKLYSARRPVYPTLAWSPDGKILALAVGGDNGHSWIELLSLADSSTRQLTAPPEASRDNSPSFSPDGSKVAFIRGSLAGVVSDLFVVPVTGGDAKRLTFDNRPMDGISWTTDGRELVFSSARGTEFTLWRVSASGGTPSRVVGVASGSYYPSVSQKGNLLAFAQQVSESNISRINLKDEKHSLGLPTVIVSDKGSKARPQFSADGKRIAFESDRLGSAEIWACDSDGANCAQLTSLHGTAGTARWSPNDRYIAFEFHPNEHAEIYVMEVPGGTPRLLPTNPGADNLAPSWSRDGEWIYFTSKRGGEPFQLWKVPAKGGSPIQITKTGGLGAVESADGRFLYYSKFESDGIWRMPLTGGAEALVLDQPSGQAWFNWCLVRDGIYFLRSSETLSTENFKSTLEFFDFATQKITPIQSLDKSPGWGLEVSSDGKSLIFVGTAFIESKIMLIKNFR